MPDELTNNANIGVCKYVYFLLHIRESFLLYIWESLIQTLITNMVRHLKAYKFCNPCVKKLPWIPGWSVHILSFSDSSGA